MATQASLLAWKIPWTEEPGGLHTVHGVAKSWTQQHTRKVKNKIFFFNGCCLEQGKDGGHMTMYQQYLSPDRML